MHQRTRAIDPTFTTFTGFNSTFYLPIASDTQKFLDAQSLPQTLVRLKTLTIKLTDTSGVDLSLNEVEWEILLRRTGKFIEAVPIPMSKIERGIFATLDKDYLI